MTEVNAQALLALLTRMAEALERAAPPDPGPVRITDAAGAFVWQPAERRLSPVARVARVELTLLQGIGPARDTLLENTRRFARGLPANNALLWGARGMGKSSLVKAVHAAVASETPVALVEIHREDLASLPDLLARLGASPLRAILFCDDLSFETPDASYKSLKAALEGGLEGRPGNVIFYATSNRRHLMARDMIENERSTAISPAEAVEEKISLSDRFGLWLGFHACPQDDYLAMIAAYCAHYRLGPMDAHVRAAALAWSAARGGRSGRVAWQFIQDLAGARGVPLA